MDRKWWKEAVGYQIFIRSFSDSNDDGIGDIRGIINRLPYLHSLGITLIWICPFFKSPQDDSGYDVSDYYDVDTDYGSIDDVKELIKESHNLGIKLMIDLTVNHTSDEHKWFRESRKSLDNPYRDYYIWEKPRFKKGVEIEPTNWSSIFTGSCWEKDPQTNEYYMHIFSKKQPDLNWANPKVREEIYDIAKWWIDLGIDGMRIDAISHFAKGKLKDFKLEEGEKYKYDFSRFSNLPKVHKYVKEFRKKVLEGTDVFAVGEIGGGAQIKETLRYGSTKRKEVDMVFLFAHVDANNRNQILDQDDMVVYLSELKYMFNRWQVALQHESWEAIYWLNHDHARLLNFYGDYHEPYLSGSMLAIARYFMRGTPFIYNGEEIGMVNYPFTKMEDYRDIRAKIQYDVQSQRSDFDEDEFMKQLALTSRDNSRTPMQWSTEKNAGFSTSQPWINVNPNYQTVNVLAQEKEPKSLLNFYKHLITIRSKSFYKDVLVYGDYTQLACDEQSLYVYVRKIDRTAVLVICNFFKEVKEYTLPYSIKEVVIHNYDDLQLFNGNITLRPFESIVFSI